MEFWFEERALCPKRIYGLIIDTHAFIFVRGSKMKSKTMHSIFLALTILIALTAPEREGWASPPDTSDDATQSPPTDRNTKLIGISVGRGGPSYAVFQSGGRTVLVREGNEIAPGLRLVQVRWKRVDAERDGVVEEIRIGGGEGTGVYRQTVLGRTDEGSQALREQARRRVRYETNLFGRK